MKLVRDQIPKIIKESGKWCLCKTIDQKEERLQWLIKKMNEEANEFAKNPSYEEAADMFEVLRACADLYSLDMDEVRCVADDKRKERGGFSEGIILEVVDDKVPDNKDR